MTQLPKTTIPSFFIIGLFANYCLTLSFIFYTYTVSTLFLFRNKLFHIHRQQLRNFKKGGKVGLSAVAYISIDRTETPSQLLCKPCLAYPFVL